ncbi:MAG: hypothetical protein M3433_04760 [Actinomycetota bacterium]|nr:hypothetical protein [Actinomycetota bacterium]MDQ3647880.1 hypothetical protein [Actinomycetota bacterium]
MPVDLDAAERFVLANARLLDSIWSSVLASPGQSVEWRGAVTLQALATLAAHGRIELPLG